MPVALSDESLLLRLRMRQLALLNLLDRERNLGRAAIALNISQPAASKLLQQIEDTFGVPLFERLVKGMAPTPHGELLIRYARRVMTEFGFVHEEMVALSSGLRGALRVGSVPGAVPELLAPALSEYKRRHPRVAVAVTVDTSNVMIRQLARGEVDLVLGRLTEGQPEGDFLTVPLLEEALVVVVRARHPLTERANVSFADLLALPWILQPPGTPQRMRFELAMREAGLNKRLNITETASTIVATAMLEISDMVAVMPASLAAHYGRLGVLRVLAMDFSIRVPPIYLITPQEDQLSPPAARFVAQLRSQAGTLAHSQGASPAASLRAKRAPAQ